MIAKNLYIVIAVEAHLEKWLHVKTLIVKKNGFTFPAFNRKIYPKNGIAWIAKNKKTKQETALQEHSL
jgi:hypothetical protein